MKNCKICKKLIKREYWESNKEFSSQNFCSDCRKKVSEEDAKKIRKQTEIRNETIRKTQKIIDFLSAKSASFLKK